MSYFDNQYGGEDEDNKFNEEDTSSDEEIEDYNLDDNEQEEDEQSGGALSEDEYDNYNEDSENDEEIENVPNSKLKKLPSNYKEEEYGDDDDDADTDEDEDPDGEQYLKKFERTVNENYILDFHPESVLHNYDEIESMTKVDRDQNGIIIDKLHRTLPFLTKYERSRILGQRAKQINGGAYPFVKVPENVIDGYIIAEMELKEKRIPFIIRRPLPNGGSEYWKLHDLEDIIF
jgi:DNA-directed RNA polymerase subunit K/omega